MLSMQSGEIIAMRGTRRVVLAMVDWRDTYAAARLFYSEPVARVVAGGALSSLDATRLGVQLGLLQATEAA